MGAGLGFIHTGHDLSFIYDIADLYKAEMMVCQFFFVGRAPNLHGELIAENESSFVTLSSALTFKFGLNLYFL